MLTEEPGSDALVGEVADLWFHSMLLLARDGLDPLAPLDVLRCAATLPERGSARFGDGDQRRAPQSCSAIRDRRRCSASGPSACCATPITIFSEGDILGAWAPVIGPELARELLNTLAFSERLDKEEFALVGELALIAEDCYRAWSAEVDTDGAEWRQVQWSYTERNDHRSMVLHIGRWDGELVEVRTSAEGLRASSAGSRRPRRSGRGRAARSTAASSSAPPR